MKKDKSCCSGEAAYVFSATVSESKVPRKQWSGQQLECGVSSTGLSRKQWRGQVCSGPLFICHSPVQPCHRHAAKTNRERSNFVVLAVYICDREGCSGPFHRSAWPQQPADRKRCVNSGLFWLSLLCRFSRTAGSPTCRNFQSGKLGQLSLESPWVTWRLAAARFGGQLRSLGGRPGVS